jgi:hypothetical protein
MSLGKEFLNLNVERKRVGHFELCRNSLLILKKYFAKSGKIEYRESVCGTHQIVDNKLPLDAFQSALSGENTEEIYRKYLEPIAAMQDDDLVFPKEIEFAYYSIYNLFRKYAMNKEIDDWLIVNQALAAESNEEKWDDLLKNAIEKSNE